jgi:hypothetical protein
MSRLKKTQLPFRWLAFTLNWTQGTAGPSVNLSTYVNNPQNRTLTYSVVGSLPSGVTLAGSTVSYNGTGAAVQTSVQFRITDGIYTAESAATALTIVAVQVNTPPSWTTSATLGSVVAGQNFNFPLTATDAQNDTINFIYANPAFGTATQGTQSGGTRSLVWAGTAPTTPGTYTFVVDAVDVPPLGQVTGLTATALSTSTIRLAWSAVNLATGYRVEQSLTGTSGWTQIAAPSALTVDATGLNASTQYFFRVRATNATQTGEYSAAASATTAAVVPDLPSYVSALAPYQVAALSTVANGKATWITAVDPLYDSTSFNGGGDNAVSSVKNIVVESGGFAVPEERKLYALGGGHADGAYNGILEFDLNGTTQATGWTEVPGSASALADIPSGAAADYVTYLTGGNYETTAQSGGKAGSTHNYGAMVYDRTSNRMARFGGSYWSTGVGQAHSWFWDRTAGEWVPAPAHGIGSASVYGAVLHDKPSRKAIYINQSTCRFFNFATGAWGNTFFNTGGILSRVQGAYDSMRSRGIVVGKGMAKTYTINWATETATVGSFTFTPATTGDTEMLGSTIEGVGVEYDSVLDRFWIFGGRDNSGGGTNPAGVVPFNKLYWFDAADLDDGAVTVRSQALSQTIGLRQSGTGFYMGIYRRYCFIPEWRAIAVATTYDQPVHVIRLPSA